MSGAAADPPGFAGILETCVYYSRPQREAVERFYVEELGLSRVAGWNDAFACRLPTGILLAFEREALGERSGPVAAHGSEGPSHVCLLAADGAYEPWRRRLRDLGVEITQEASWPDHKRSFYFHDPAGNLLEIADQDIWPR